MGEILSIWIKRSHGGPMDSVSEARLVAGRGIVDNADQGGWRQITLVDEAAWQGAVHELGTEVDPSARRANVLLRGVDLENSRGRILRLGECVIHIQGETRPFHLMDEAERGLRNGLRSRWRGGAFSEIVEGGTIRVGDRVGWNQI